jgi:hypothetical protein
MMRGTRAAAMARADAATALPAIVLATKERREMSLIDFI